MNGLNLSCWFVGVLFTVGGTAAACGDKGDDKSKAAKGHATAPVAVDAKPVAARPKPAEPTADAAEAWSWSLPKGINVPPVVPDDNPMTADKVELGHQLFMDKALSVDGSRSCYSCHQNELGNADGRAKALGPGDKVLPRNSPTIWNVGLHTTLYWDGRAPHLEAQAIGALKGGNMGLGDGLEAKAAEIGAMPQYKGAFAKAFGMAPTDKVTPDHIAKALSAYERTLLCGDSGYDHLTLEDAASRGADLFVNKGQCATCHLGDNLSDGLFHRTGIGVQDPKAEGVDLGRGKVTGNTDDNFRFRTPTLRNVGRTAPYFHDGSVATLEEAVRFMAKGGDASKGPVDEKLADRKLSDAEIADLVAFLQALDCKGTLEVIGDQTVPGIGDSGDAK